MILITSAEGHKEVVAPSEGMRSERIFEVALKDY